MAVAPVTIQARQHNVIGNLREDHMDIFVEADASPDTFTVQTRLHWIDHVTVYGTTTENVNLHVWKNYSDAGTTQSNGTIFVNNVTNERYYHIVAYGW